MSHTSSPQDPILSAEFSLGFNYTRSPGPLLGRFFAALADRRLFGIRGSNGRVLFPPTEYDPHTGDSLSEWVEVGSLGTVVASTWISEPKPSHRCEHPFAFALILLDGADTPFLHRVFGEQKAIAPGTCVKAVFSEQPVGAITDIDYFEPVEDAP